MRPALLDTDAFHVLRNIGLLDGVLGGHKRVAGHPMRMGYYSATRELSSLATLIAQLTANGLLETIQVHTRDDPGSEKYRDLRGRVDKGEAEAIAWASTLPKRERRPIFVSNDTGATRAAQKEGLSAIDAFDLVVLAVEEKLIEPRMARDACVPWEDKQRQFGRPPDFTTYEATHAKRREALIGIGLLVQG